MVWSAKDEGIVTIRRRDSTRVRMLSRGSNEPEIECRINPSFWRSTRAVRQPTLRKRKREREQSLSDSDYDPNPRSQNSVPEPVYDSEPERASTRSSVAVAGSRQKSQRTVLPQQQASPVPPRAPPASPKLAGVSRSNVVVGAHAPTTPSTCSRLQNQAQQSDDDLVILDEEPDSWKSQSKVKQEAVAVKKEPLAVPVRSLF